MIGKWQSSIFCGALALFLCLSPSGAQANLDSCEELSLGDYAEEGCIIPLQDVHLTQYAVGKIAVTCKISKVDKKIKDTRASKSQKNTVKALNKYLEAENRHLPLVRGPDVDGKRNFYTTDHHHLGTAVRNSKVFKGLSPKNQKKVVFVATVGTDYSYYKKWNDFWKKMISKKKAWNYDNHGKKISDGRFNNKYGPFPKDFAEMYSNPDHNDKYRSLSRWVRESCLYLKAGKDQCDKIVDDFGIAPQAADFMEFVWADYLRKEFPWSEEPSGSDFKVLKGIYDKSTAPMRSPEAVKWLTTGQNYDPIAYGYHANGQHLKLDFDGSCEDPTKQIITK
jgi:hypothetical protein